MISAGKTFLRCRSHPLFSLSLSVFCTSRLFWLFTPHSPSIMPLLSCVLSSYLLLSSLHVPSLQPLSSSPLTSILPQQTWPYLGLWERGLVRVVGWGGGRDYRHGDPHQNIPTREGWERVHTFPVVLLQSEQEESLMVTQGLSHDSVRGHHS